MKQGLTMTMAALAMVACGGDDGDGGPTDPNATDGTMTASVSGAAAFAADVVIGSYTNNVLVISAVQGPTGNSRSIVLTVNNVTGTGQFNFTLPGNGAQYIETTGISSASWLTAITQGSGSVTLATATPTRVVGSFSFTAPALSGGATGTKTVSGQFDIVPSNPN